MRMELAGKSPGRKEPPGERWTFIRASLEDQASGALHVDAGTKDHVYSRTEVETLIGMMAALLGVVP